MAKQRRKKAPSRAAVTAEVSRCLRINAPGWFRRGDFQDFLNQRTQCHARADPAEAWWGLATWHRPGDRPGEFSDVFATFDHGEGSDQDACPADVWAHIREIAGRHGFTSGVVWITNCSGAEGLP